MPVSNAQLMPFYMALQLPEECRPNAINPTPRWMAIGFLDAAIYITSESSCLGLSQNARLSRSPR
jgi:hypothetical protein